VSASGNSVGAFPLTDPLSRDAALVTELTPGVYSVKVAGKNRITGTALAEIYDADPTLVAPSVPRLINLSARATTGNSNPLIAGFVIGGTTARTVLIRAIGPDLTQYVGPAALDDPKLELYVREGGMNRLVAANDDWAGSPLFASLGSRVGAFPLPDPSSLDAALVVTLDPGVYSAKVLGVNNASGITLVEIYEVP
jgi:hypothetical protein